jgi:excisionase family DNA binding protein
VIVLPQNFFDFLAPRRRREKRAQPLVGGLPKWLTAEQAAEYLQVETRTVLTWARLGQLKAHPLSGTKRKVWRFLHADLDAMLTGPSVAEPRRVQ